MARFEAAPRAPFSRARRRLLLGGGGTGVDEAVAIVLATSGASICRLRSARPLTLSPWGVRKNARLSTGYWERVSCPAWSAIRPRLSSRPRTLSTSKMPGEVERPVSAARNGWATIPSFAPSSSA